MKFGKLFFGMAGLAFGLALGFGMGLVVAWAGYSYAVQRWGGEVVVTAPSPAPSAGSQLMAEVLGRQRAGAATDGELSWLKKRTGVDCGVAVSDEECLPFLATLSDQPDIIGKVGELGAAGVKVLVTKRSAFQELEIGEGKATAVAGEISESGTILFLYREASPPEVKAFLFR